MSTTANALDNSEVPTGRIVARLAIIMLVCLSAVKAVIWATQWDRVVDLFTKADHAIYMAQAARVRAGGPLYPDWQIAGRFTPEQLPNVYPPQTVYGLFVPMSFLPDALWWLIPIAIVSLVIAHHRPSPWAWVAILACLSVPHTWTSLAAGNPAMFVAAAVAVGTLWAPAFALAPLKPTLAPFALLGVRSRGWWVGVAIWIASSLVLWSAMRDYITVLLNYQGDGLFALVANVPLVAIPIVAWLGRERREGRGESEALLRSRSPAALTGAAARGSCRGVD